MKSQNLQRAVQHLSEASQAICNKTWNVSSKEWQALNALRLSVAAILDELEKPGIGTRTEIKNLSVGDRFKWDGIEWEHTGTQGAFFTVRSNDGQSDSLGGDTIVERLA